MAEQIIELTGDGSEQVIDLLAADGLIVEIYNAQLAPWC